MTRRWHFWVILAVIIIGLVVVLWPAPVEDAPLPGPPPAVEDASRD